MTLLLDCKTRWNSLLTMLKRFCELQKAVGKAMIDIPQRDRKPAILTTEELDRIQKVVSALNVVKVGSDMMCRRDANLLTADTTIKFMLRHLRQQDTGIASALAEAIHSRVLQRRTMASAVLQFLHDSTDTDSDDLPEASVKEVQKYVIRLVQRLTPDLSEEQQAGRDSPAEDELACAEEAESINLKDTLEKAVFAAVKTTQAREPIDSKKLNQVVRNEVLHLSTSGRGTVTGKAYGWLMSVVPTSVEAERVFSTVGNIVTKLRTRLGDRTVDALTFLKCYYKRK
mgnify:CR=1 FL=1